MNSSERSPDSPHDLSALADRLAARREELARCYLARATEALRYDAEAPRAVQDATSALAGGVAVAMAEPGWTEARRVRCVDDLRYHVDYLADAVALRRPQLHAAYVGFVAELLERHRVPRAHLRRALELLAQQFVATMPPATASTCHDTLALAMRGFGP